MLYATYITIDESYSTVHNPRMIDVAREKLLTKEEAARFCQVSIPTVERWIRKGVKRTGRRLEVVYLGGSMRTSVEAIGRFSVHPELTAPAPITNGQAALARFKDLDSRRARKQRTP